LSEHGLLFKYSYVLGLGFKVVHIVGSVEVKLLVYDKVFIICLHSPNYLNFYI
jgi:hypothetical protein